MNFYIIELRNSRSFQINDTIFKYLKKRILGFISENHGSLTCKLASYSYLFFLRNFQLLICTSMICRVQADEQSLHTNL